MNAHSIYVRLILGYTLLVVCASIGFGTYTYKSLQTHLYLEMHSTLARRIEHIRKDVLPFFDTKNTATLKSQIEQIFSPEESNRYIKILRNDSDVAYLSGTPQDKSFNPQSVKFNPYYLANNCEQGVSSSFDNNLLILKHCDVAKQFFS